MNNFSGDHAFRSWNSSYRFTVISRENMHILVQLISDAVIVGVQIPQSQTTAPVSGAGSSIEDAIKSTSTVENIITSPASEAAPQSADATGNAASSFAGKVSEGAGKITELGGGLPDAATSASQAAPGSVEAAGKDACVPANRTCASRA